MTRSSCIVELPGSHYSVLKMEYLIITGNECAAKILRFLVKWTDWKIAQSIQAKHHNDSDVKEGGKPTQDDSLWIYNSIPEIRKALLFEYSEKTIANSIKILTEKKFIQTRKNPRHKWDQKTQYLLEREIVQEAILSVTEEQVTKFFPGGIPEEMKEFLARFSKKGAISETPDSTHPVNLPDQESKFTGSTTQDYGIDDVDLPGDPIDQINNPSNNLSIFHENDLREEKEAPGTVKSTISSISSKDIDWQELGTSTEDNYSGAAPSPAFEHPTVKCDRQFTAAGGLHPWQNTRVLNDYNEKFCRWLIKNHLCSTPHYKEKPQITLRDAKSWINVAYSLTRPDAHERLNDVQLKWDDFVDFEQEQARKAEILEESITPSVAPFDRPLQAEESADDRLSQHISRWADWLQNGNDYQKKLAMDAIRKYGITEEQLGIKIPSIV